MMFNLLLSLNQKGNIFELNLHSRFLWLKEKVKNQVEQKSALLNKLKPVKIKLMMMQE